MSARSFAIVVAQCQSGGIGLSNTIPWHLPGDLKFFKKVTSECCAGRVNAVVMGRKTYESLPPSFRPLPNRLNVILSRDQEVRARLQLPQSVLVASSLDQVSAILPENVEKVFVIGGAAVYKEALLSRLCSRVYLTQLETDFACDTFFPTVPAALYKLTSKSKPVTEKDIAYSFLQFDRLEESSDGGNPEEQQYLHILADIMDNGVIRGDRTGTGTISKFGVQMRFSLRDDVFPLLTTKKVFWRGVCEELLWFVSGSTNANLLAAKDIHIWDGNGSREFLDSRGLSHHEEGDLGPVYGFQWRHFGAVYEGMNADYTGKGIDQLKRCIQSIVSNPEDRRIILTAWNPSDVDKMALPPCHMFCQFYVANNELSCQMYQRSADMGLGVPFNIASYALLTRMVAQVCGLKCGDFVHTIGDAHVYLNHIDGLREQLKRMPAAFPKLTINPKRTDIDSFELHDFTITDYFPQATIKMKMAV